MRAQAPASSLPQWQLDLLVTGIALALVLAWDAVGLDLKITRLFAGPAGFAWRDAWLTRSLLHEGGRILAWLGLILLVFNVWRPLIAGPTQAQRWQWALVTLSCAVLVPALKRFSTTSCPWDLAEFGGVANFVSHWQWRLSDGGPGHCFPSGHAVSAFGFLPGWFVLRRSRPRLAQGWLAVVLLLGLLFGGGQLVRGAHHVSHTLWTAWICWAWSALVFAACDASASAERVGQFVGVSPSRLPRSRDQDPV
jgi:membrane-associated PAP2 superfamily phosphatase